MRPGLQEFCEYYIANRKEVKSVFKYESDSVYSICSNIFLSKGKTAHGEEIRKCKEIIRQSTSFVNNFRGTMYAPSASLLACSHDPSGMMYAASENYKMLKGYFTTSEQLVLASLILSDMTSPENARATAARGRYLYDRMKENHRLLTGSEDSVFAILLAFSGRSDQELIAETERCFELLKGTVAGEYIQTVSHILAMDERAAYEKCARFNALLESIRRAGLNYGKKYELSVLASLSLRNAEIPEIVSDIADTDAFLKTQKGYKGLLGTASQTRLMHSVMLVDTFLSPTAAGGVAAAASVVSIVAIQMLIIMSITMSSAAAASSH